MATELILLGTAGGPIPVPHRAGTSSALVVDGVVYVIDCGRGSPTRFVEAGLRFSALGGIFLTHLHVDHVGDLPGMLLYPWGTSPAPVQVWGPGSPKLLPQGEPPFMRHTLMSPEHPVPGTSALVEGILAAYSYHLNVMPLDLQLPDAATLVQAHEILTDRPDEPADDGSEAAKVILQTDAVTISAITVAHGHAHPALAYRFDTAEGSVVFSGDTRTHGNLVTLAQGADILVHEVVDLDYLREHGTPPGGIALLKRLHTDVHDIGALAERAGVSTVLLNHYLPAMPGAVAADDWASRASLGFSGTVIAGEDGMRLTL